MITASIEIGNSLKVSINSPNLNQITIAQNVEQSQDAVVFHISNWNALKEAIEKLIKVSKEA